MEDSNINCWAFFVQTKSRSYNNSPSKHHISTYSSPLVKSPASTPQIASTKSNLTKSSVKLNKLSGDHLQLHSDLSLTNANYLLKDSQNSVDNLPKPPISKSINSFRLPPPSLSVPSCSYSDPTPHISSDISDIESYSNDSVRFYKVFFKAVQKIFYRMEFKCLPLNKTKATKDSNSFFAEQESYYRNSDLEDSQPSVVKTDKLFKRQSSSKKNKYAHDPKRLAQLKKFEPVHSPQSSNGSYPTAVRRDSLHLEHDTSPDSHYLIPNVVLAKTDSKNQDMFNVEQATDENKSTDWHSVERPIVVSNTYPSALQKSHQKKSSKTSEENKTEIAHLNVSKAECTSIHYTASPLHIASSQNSNNSKDVKDFAAIANFKKSTSFASFHSSFAFENLCPSPISTSRYLFKYQTVNINAIRKSQRKFSSTVQRSHTEPLLTIRFSSLINDNFSKKRLSSAISEAETTQVLNVKANPTENWTISYIFPYLEYTERLECALTCRLWFINAYSTPILINQFPYGFPQSNRRFIWKLLLFKQGIYCTAKEYELLSTKICTFDADIDRDVGRTFPKKQIFQGEQSYGQKALMRILRACCNRVKEVGYCQGINFVAATLLTVFDEMTSFQCLLSMLHQWDLKLFYQPNFPKLKLSIFQFSKFVEAYLPRIHEFMNFHKISADFYSLQWFMTLFTYDLHFDILLKVWDLFFLYGWKIIFQISLALLQHIEDTLLPMRFDDALSFLKGFTRTHLHLVATEQFLVTAYQFCVTTQLLEDLETAYYAYGDAKLQLKNNDLIAKQWFVEPIQSNDALNANLHQVGKWQPVSLHSVSNQDLFQTHILEGTTEDTLQPMHDREKAYLLCSTRIPSCSKNKFFSHSTPEHFTCPFVKSHDSLRSLNNVLQAKKQAMYYQALI